MFFNVITFLALAAVTLAASLQQVSGWGQGPSGVSMYIYVPDRRAANPGILVAAHACGGSAQNMYSSTRLPSYADQHGFIIIYPQTTRNSNCWDVFSPASLTRNGGGETQALAAMVQYTLRTYNGNPDRVYMMGVSSGAMMANVMCAVYADLFEGGASFSGVPAGCFAGAPTATPMSPNQTCAQGQIIKTPQEWGNFARNMYPGYTGRRPRMQIWHGTADFLVTYPTFTEQLKQWSNVLGLSFTRNETGIPSAAYTRMMYGDGTKLQGFSASGVGHIVPVNEQLMLDYFGLTGSGPAPSGPSTSTSLPVTTPPMTTPPSTGGPAQTVWGQCGGSGWNGPTSCVPTATCVTQNPWYAQCRPN